MKAIGLVCEDCGTLITARPDSPERLQCPNCGGGVRRQVDTPTLEPSLVGVAPAAPMDVHEADPPEHPREVFHRLVPWLGSCCVHAAGMLMLMFAVAQAVSPPTPSPSYTPGKIPVVNITGGVQSPPNPVPFKDSATDGSMFNRRQQAGETPTAHHRPNAQSPWGVQNARGSAGGGKEEGLARTRKVPNPAPITAYGGGQHVSLPGDRDFDPKGPGGMGLFPGPDGADPYGPDPVIGIVGPPSIGPVGGSVDNVVFVIDQSGSVLTAFDLICNELCEYISWLNEKQSFHVVFFAKDTFQENPARRLMPATDPNKLDAVRFLRTVRASGYGSCPIPALEAGFRALAGAPAAEGKLLYLLTDGDFETSGHVYNSGGRVLRGNDAVVAWLHDHNANQAVQVNVIIVGDRPSSDTEACMRSIAKDNRGVYHYVLPPK